MLIISRGEKYFIIKMKKYERVKKVTQHEAENVYRGVLSIAEIPNIIKTQSTHAMFL